MGDRGARRNGRLLTWRRARWALLAVVVALPVARAGRLYLAGTSAPLRVGLVYEPSALPSLAFVRDAWESVFREEGVPHTWVSTTDLSLLSGADAADRYLALVFPDALVRHMPADVAERVGEYLDAGGDVAVVYDPGIREPDGAFRSGGLLAPYVGVEYLRYRQDPDRAYVEGNVHFATEELASEWGIPPGKLYRGEVVGGYAYGSLTYPMANAEVTATDLELIAESDGVPVITLRDVGEGTAMWVNLPLGYLKAYSDDLPLRALMRTFLFDVAGVPHLVPAPGGIGGLVIDWHIDSAVEWEGIPSLIRNDLVRRGLPMQFDVTAGPDRDEPGDGLGFDACGKGREDLERLLAFGEVGAHGGWGHNLFSEGLEDRTLSRDEATELLALNVDCLVEVAGSPVRGYAAPNGVHPQPMMTELLEAEGVVGYYYTGDTGSPPNRTFFDGEMVSDRVWAFPVMPNGLFASIGEMVKNGRRPREIERWLRGTLDYAVQQRSIRLVYSHPYDLLPARYQRVFGRFLDRVEEERDRGALTVEPMSGYVAFLDRFLATRATFAQDGAGLTVVLENPGGLRDITVALPKEMVVEEAVVPDGVEVHAAGNEVLFTVTTDATRVEMRFGTTGPG